jgi:outer membrane protein OmpA-like peptidoglycan-associated protein/tetratricopeptide (TPR) repeat protein
MRSFFIALLVVFTSLSAFNQTSNITDIRNIFDEKGDYYFQKEEYKKAILYFNMAFQKDSKNYYSVLRKAEAFEALGLYPQAVACYQLAFESNLRISNVYRLQYALALLEVGNVSEFEKWISQYKEVVTSDTRGKNYIATKDDRAKLYKDTTIIKVTSVDEINTVASEITPMPREEQLIFASNAQNNIYHLLATDYSSGKLTKAEPYNTSLNSSNNELAANFYDISNSLYFSRSGDNNSDLKTFETFIPLNAQENLEVIEVSIEGFTNIGHVAFNSEGTSMFFVSDATGGNGGLDIYSADFENGQWVSPKNLGASINSNGDDMYPFIVNDTILYFSSDGHNGFGGFDLYKANLNTGKIENLGGSINTAYNEFSLSFTNNGNTAYFASDRPGGKGGEDIYRAHILDLQIKYAYVHKVRTNIEDDKINLYISNGDEYNIASGDSGFDFSFLPQEPYKLVIQRENTTADNIVKKQNYATTELLKPQPTQKAEIPLQAGMKFQFTAGFRPLSNAYVSDLENMAGDYQTSETSTIDLTALAKELLFTDGEIYTIRFVKDKERTTGYKAKGESSLFVNNEEVNLFGQTFFIVLPLDNEANFNIATDIDHFKENFNPKKYGVVIDKGAVFTDDTEADKQLISLLVNTENISDISTENKLNAEYISIIPGSEYILSMSKLDQTTNEEIEIFVPLTRGVKYNLGSEPDAQDEFEKAFATLIAGREGLEPSNEEVIDISILSKELDFQAGDIMSFNLLPAKSFGKVNYSTEETRLTLDGQEIKLNKEDRYAINVPFLKDRNLNIQTDINYVLENFELQDIVIALDTIPFFWEIAVDTTGLSTSSADWLSVKVNTEKADEVESKNQLVSNELSIIPGKEYILTVSKKDAITGKETEIIVPLTRKVKYDFTSKPMSESEYQKSLNDFLASQDEFETTGGELIDISMLSKELEIKEGDDVSFSLLPAKVFKDGKIITEASRSNLYLDQKVVEFTQIQKYTINIPLNDQQVNIQTDIEHIQEIFEPGSYTLDVDTLSFFAEITVDTTGYGYMVQQESEITDPVFDVVVVNFDLDDYSLRPKAVYTLDGNVVEELQKDNRLYVTIKGYTDGLGNADYNKELSRKRANSVKDYLQTMGIGEDRIRTFSFGDSHKLKEGVKWEDLSEKELEKHRKVEIVIYLPE